MATKDIIANAVAAQGGPQMSVAGVPDAVATPKPPAPAATPVPVAPATAPKTTSPSVMTAQPAVKKTQANVAGVTAAEQQMAVAAAQRASAQPGSTALATLPTQQQISPTVNAQGMTAAQMAAGVNTPLPSVVPTQNATAISNPAAPKNGGIGIPEDQARKFWEKAGNNMTGWQMNPDGTWTPDSSVDLSVGAAALGSAGQDSKKPLTYSEQAAKAAGEFQVNSNQIVEDAQNAYNEFKSSIDQIQNGTFPLSPADQAQLDDIKANFQMVIDQQLQANKAYESAVKVSGVRSGRDMYAPRVNAGNIQAAVSAGVAKIADINVKMASAISTAKQAIKDGNLKALDMVYKGFNDLQVQKSKQIADLYQTTKDVLEATRQQHADELEEAKFQFEVEKELMKPAQEADAAAQKVLFDLYTTYPDAGIDPFNDSMVEAGEKVRASASYKQSQKEKQEAVISRYEYAKTQGYEGSLMQFMKEEKDTGPVSVGGYLVDPVSGRIVFAPPDEATTYSLSPGEKVFDASGKVIASNPSSDDRIITLSAGETAFDAEGNVVAEGPSGGPPKTTSINGVDSVWDADKGKYVPAPVEGGGKSIPIITSLQGKVSLIDELLANNALPGAVGVLPGGQTELAPWKWAGKADFIAGVAQLLSSESLNALLELKRQGGTLGALSEKELQILNESASKIGAWIVRDKNNNVTGFRAGEKQFKEELQKLKMAAKNAIDLENGFTYDPEDPEYLAYRASPELKEFTNKEIWEDLQEQRGKHNEGSDSNNAQIVTTSVGGKTIKVSKQIENRLAQADRDFYKATGQHLQINQHYRTREEQEKLYKELSAKGARVAPPGQSFHEKGLAIDVTNWKEAEPYLRKYGLVNDLDDDKGHFSFGETNHIG